MKNMAKVSMISLIGMAKHAVKLETTWVDDIVVIITVGVK